MYGDDDDDGGDHVTWRQGPRAVYFAEDDSPPQETSFESSETAPTTTTQQSSASASSYARPFNGSRRRRPRPLSNREGAVSFGASLTTTTAVLLSQREQEEVVPASGGGHFERPRSSSPPRNAKPAATTTIKRKKPTPTTHTPSRGLHNLPATWGAIARPATEPKKQPPKKKKQQDTRRSLMHTGRRATPLSPSPLRPTSQASTLLPFPPSQQRQGGGISLQPSFCLPMQSPVTSPVPNRAPKRKSSGASSSSSASRRCPIAEELALVRRETTAAAARLRSGEFPYSASSRGGATSLDPRCRANFAIDLTFVGEVPPLVLAPCLAYAHGPVTLNGSAPPGQPTDTFVSVLVHAATRRALGLASGSQVRVYDPWCVPATAVPLIDGVSHTVLDTVLCERYPPEEPPLPPPPHTPANLLDQLNQRQQLPKHTPLTLAL